jgi:short-subunit dehydrogenase
LKDKVVIITGASSGIGKACAKYFAQQGCKIAIAARNKEQLQAIADELKQHYGNCIAIPTDVSLESDCKHLIDATIEAYGNIDVLINNAGISMRALFHDLSLEVMHQVMNINFWGTVYCTKYALPYLLKSHGSVVGVSSIAGKKGLPGRCAYSASKFAMEGFLETLRTENRKNNLHVLVACPGYTSSNIRKTALNKDGKSQQETPLDESKLMKAEEVAFHIYNAVLKRKRDLILTTNGKLTVMLNKLFPSWMDKIVYNFVAREPDSPFT